MLGMALAFTFSSFAQWSGTTDIYNTNLGNVGIGTTNMQVYSGYTTLTIGDNNASRAALIKFRSTYNSGNGAEIYQSTSGMVAINTNSVTNALNILAGGNVGIGTTSPSARLTVAGTIAGRYNATYPTTGAGYYSLSTNNEDAINGGFSVNILSSGTLTEAMRINYLGNVGIGTTDPQGYKLAINGSAIAESVTVKLHGSWPDYVFKPRYKLLPLNEVKTYIDKNQHLPNMPSEQEVKDNGINLGEIVKLQTKKIEELTLYLIEQQKQIEDLKALVTKK